MPATPDGHARRDDEAILLYMALARQMAKQTRESVQRALERSRAMRQSADAAIERAETRLQWVKAAKQRLNAREAPPA